MIGEKLFTACDLCKGNLLGSHQIGFLRPNTKCNCGGTFQYVRPPEWFVEPIYQVAEAQTLSVPEQKNEAHWERVSLFGGRQTRSVADYDTERRTREHNAHLDSCLDALGDDVRNGLGAPTTGWPTHELVKRSGAGLIDGKNPWLAIAYAASLRPRRRRRMPGE